MNSSPKHSPFAHRTNARSTLAGAGWPGSKTMSDMASPTLTLASLSTLHPFEERSTTAPSPSASPLNEIESAKREKDRRQVGGTGCR